VDDNDLLFSTIHKSYVFLNLREREREREREIISMIVWCEGEEHDEGTSCHICNQVPTECIENVEGLLFFLKKKIVCSLRRKKKTKWIIFLFSHYKNRCSLTRVYSTRYCRHASNLTRVTSDTCQIVQASKMDTRMKYTCPIGHVYLIRVSIWTRV